MKGKRNNPRGGTEEDEKKEEEKKEEEKEEEEEPCSWTAFRGFVEFLRPWIESERGKGEARTGHEMSPPCHCPRRVPYTEGRYRGGGSPPLRIVYRRRFKKGMTFYRAARSISRARWREGGRRSVFSSPADARNDLVATLSGASTENVYISLRRISNNYVSRWM